MLRPFLLIAWIVLIGCEMQNLMVESSLAKMKREHRLSGKMLWAPLVSGISIEEASLIIGGRGAQALRLIPSMAVSV